MSSFNDSTSNLKEQLQERAFLLATTEIQTATVNIN